jgi:hypothetical protein
MAYTLYRNGKELFHREEKHWWLTGFKPGEFSEPWELSVKYRIQFKDSGMCKSFVRAMKKLGYQEHEIITNGTAVEFLFDKPHSPQPLTRTEKPIGSSRETTNGSATDSWKSPENTTPGRKSSVRSAERSRSFTKR